HLTYLIDLDRLARKQAESEPLEARCNLLIARARNALANAFPDVADCLQLDLVDQQQLAASSLLRELCGARKAIGDAPQGALEELVAASFEEVLERDGVHRDTDFFQEGGNSLQVARLAGRLQDKSGYAVPLQLVFEAPTVRRLAEALEGCGRSVSVPLEPADRSRPIPLSPQQESLWFLDKL
ncbi:phosphopantetheine-binding protein, partial [Roseibium sp. RKSG952]|uniref:phosphopantetheine-binding protein n=1 Tax=Roseibium sp. RKSG952 TaxID=2529384 RepID=UPI0012BBCA32